MHLQQQHTEMTTHPKAYKNLKLIIQLWVSQALHHITAKDLKHAITLSFRICSRNVHFYAFRNIGYISVNSIIYQKLFLNQLITQSLVCKMMNSYEEDRMEAQPLFIEQT